MAATAAALGVVAVVAAQASADTKVSNIDAALDSAPNGITAGPGGALYVAGFNGQSINRLTPAGAVLTPFLTLNGTGPAYVTTGPDNNSVFFTNFQDKIGRMNADGSNPLSFDLPDTVTNGRGIVAGPDGRIWFTSRDSDQLWRIDAANGGNGVAYATSAGGEGVTRGPAGDTHIYYVTTSGSKLGIKDTAPGALNDAPQEFPTSPAPYGITLGPDNVLWITSKGDVNNPPRVTRMSTAGNILGSVNLPAGSDPRGIAVGPDGALWIALAGTGKVGRLTTGGAYSEITPVAACDVPQGVATGPDRAVYVTCFGGGANPFGERIVRIATSTLASTGTNVSAKAGTAFSGQVATFTDESPSTAGNYTATISWGNGQTSAGTVTNTGGNGFAVAGTITYGSAGTAPISVAIVRKDDAQPNPDIASTTATATATIAADAVVLPGPSPLVTGSFTIPATVRKGAKFTVAVAFTGAVTKSRVKVQIKSVAKGPGAIKKFKVIGNKLVTGTKASLKVRIARPGRYLLRVTYVNPAGKVVTIRTAKIQVRAK